MSNELGVQDEATCDFQFFFHKIKTFLLFGLGGAMFAVNVKCWN